MPPDQRFRTCTSAAASATDLALERMRRDVRSAVEELHKVRAVCAAIREARHQSAEKHARHLEASQRLMTSSWDLLARLELAQNPRSTPLGGHSTP